jgi:zinc finger FYVE domain-containing protein 26
MRLFPEAAADVPSGLLQHAELNVTLHAAFDDPTAVAAAEEIRQYHHLLISSRPGVSPPTLAEPAVEVLEALLETKPAAALALSNLLVGGDAGLPPHGDAALRSRLLAAQVTLVARALETVQFSQTINLLSELQVLPNDVQPDKESTLTDLVQALVANTNPFAADGFEDAFGAGRLVAQSRERQQVEAALMDRSTPFLIQQLCQQEVQEHASLFEADVALAAGVSEPDFWGKYFLYASATGKHVLERVMEAAAHFIDDRNFDALHQLLSPAQLQPLRSLVLLAGWASCADDPDVAAKLVTALHPDAAAAAAAAVCTTPTDDGGAADFATANNGRNDGAVSTAVEMACQQVAHQVEVVKCCGDYLRTDVTLNDLHNHLSKEAETIPSSALFSPLRVLSSQVEIDRLPSSTLLQLLRARPTTGISEVERDRDITVYESFCALVSVLRAIQIDATEREAPEADASSQQQQHAEEASAEKRTGAIESMLADAQTRLQQVYPVNYRVEILEDIFSLLFITSTDLGSSNTSENAPSASGTPSEPADTNSSTRSTTSDQFVATERIVLRVINLVQVCLVGLQDALADGEVARSAETATDDDKAARPIPATVSAISLGSRIARLEQHINEAQWRLQLVTRRATRGTETSAGRSSAKAAAGVASNSIIRQMLASPKSLLTASLKAHDYSGVDEVIEMFDMNDQSSKDALMARRLAEVSSALTGSKASASTQATLIDGLLVNLNPAVAAHMCVDLAITSSDSRDVCETLLDRGGNFCSEVPGSGGDISAVTAAGTVLSPVAQKLRRGMEVVGLPLPRLILEHPRPMDVEGLTSVKASAKEEEEAHVKLAAAVKAAAVDSDSSGPAATVALKAVEAVYARARASDGSGNRGVHPGEPYVEEFLGQLETLAKAAHGVDLDAPIGVHNPLSQLKEDPMTTLAQLVFEDEIALDAAERVSARLGTDLTEVIVRHSCPRLGDLPQQEEMVEEMSASHARSTHVKTSPLTEVGRKSSAAIGHRRTNSGGGKLANACGVSHELLKRMCTLLKPFRVDGANLPFRPSIREAIKASEGYIELCASISELRKIDLTLLSGPERLCCYTNVVNLMRLHGCIEFGPPGSAAHWVQWSQSVTYGFGRLGEVSLFDLEHSFLRHEQPAPMTWGSTVLKMFIEEITPDDPRIQFVSRLVEPALPFAIWNGGASSPTPIPLLPATYQSVLHAARTAYLMRHVQVKGGGGIVLIPRLLSWYLIDFFPGEQATMEDVLPYIASALPAGSSTHAYIQSARTSTASYAEFSYAPVCHLVDLSSVDHHYLGASTPLTPAAAEQLLMDDEALVTTQYKLDPRAATYLGEKSPLVGIVAKLLQAPVPAAPSTTATPTRPTREKSDGFMGQSSVGMSLAIGSVLPTSYAPTSQPSTPTRNKERESVSEYEDYFAHASEQTKDLPLLCDAVERRVKLLRDAEVLHTPIPGSVPALLLDIVGPVRDRACCYIVNTLVDHCRWATVVELLDGGLLRDMEGNLDLVLCGLVNSMENHSQSWKSIGRLHDKVLAAVLTLQEIVHWDVDTAVEILLFCQCHLNLVAAKMDAAPADDSNLNTSRSRTISEQSTMSGVSRHRTASENSVSADDSGINYVNNANTFVGGHTAAHRRLESVQGKVDDLLDRMKVYAEILRLHAEWETWEAIERDSQEHPNEIKSKLVGGQEFGLARRWATLHGVVVTEIEQNYLLLLLDTDDLLEAQRVLDSLAPELAVEVCEFLLLRLNRLQSVIFVTRFMMQPIRALLPPGRADELKQVRLGATMLLLLPEDMHAPGTALRSVMSCPARIFEQLLIDSDVALASQVLTGLDASERAILLSHTVSVHPPQDPNTSAAAVDPDATSTPVLDRKASLLISNGNADPPKRNPPVQSDLAALSDSELEQQIAIESSVKVGASRLLEAYGTGGSVAMLDGADEVNLLQRNAEGNSERFQTELLRRQRAAVEPVPFVHDLVSFYAGKALQIELEEAAGTSTEDDQEKGPPAMDRSITSTRSNNTTSTQPISWVLDDDVRKCMVCSENFNLLNRRHHCRHCGRVICARCSINRAPHADYKVEVRTCDPCYEALLNGSIGSNTSRGTRPYDRELENRPRGMTMSAVSDDGSLAAGGRNQLEALMEGDEDARRSRPSNVWQAVLDRAVQHRLRGTFFYTQAPSTTLCMAIVALYENPERSGEVCLHLCNRISEQLALNPEMYDHYFVITTIRGLLYHAKLKFRDCGEARRVGLCDAYLAHAELLRMLLASRCPYLLSITDLTDPDKARRLRDRLIEDDKMDLAREVAIKCSLDAFEVWSAWGLAKLRLGLYEDAAEKFAHCLNETGQSSDPRDAPQQTQLVESIIAILESPPCPMIDDIKFMQEELRATLAAATTASARSEAHLHQYRQAVLHGAPPEPADGQQPALVPARRALFLPPLIAVQTVNQGRVSPDSPLNGERFGQAQFYLKKYGFAKGLCNFYLRHGFMEHACRYLVDAAEVPARVFVETVYVHALSHGQMDDLKFILKAIDPTLERWAQQLLAACGYSNQRKLVSVLYDLQVFMGDDFRAGITSLKFAGGKGFAVEKRMELLEQARCHFNSGRQAGLERAEDEPPATAEDGPKLKLRLAAADVEKYIKTITFQVALINFFKEEAANAKDESEKMQLLELTGLSLFNELREKIQVCVEMLHRGSNLEEAFRLSRTMIETFSISTVDVLSAAAARIALESSFSNQEAKASQFLSFVAPLVTNDEWDTVLRAMVNEYSKLDSMKQAEKLVSQMKGAVSKIDANIACNKLKAAYLVAVRAKLHDQIVRIHKLAVETDNRGVVSICDAYLAKNPGGNR